jgi:UDP-GlcNAc3NAcA epimerase
MIDLLTVVGARPQFVKASALSREFALGDWGIAERILHTGQHADEAMSAVFFQELGMPEPVHRFVLTASGVAARLGQMMESIASVTAERRPDVMLVYGDTDSTWAGAWVAARAGIPLVHVEAGLRSGDRAMPEELNRVLTDHVADLLFCPTDGAVRHLAAEGIVHDPAGQAGRPVRVVRTGDILCDVARWAADRVSQGPQTHVGLVTMHRPANVDDPARLRRWMEALCGSTSGRIVFPVHPRTALVLHQIWGAAWPRVLAAGGVDAVEPMGYLELAAALQRVDWVLTDSGGVQKEAFFHAKPCWVARPVTEWAELVTGGWARLVPEPEGWRGALERDAAGFPPPGDDRWSVPLYGDGRSARSMAQEIQQLATSRQSGANVSE